jgi:PAS domain S-box-containing protein
VLAGLGAAAAFLSISVPHTEVYLEGRLIFGYIGFALLRRWWLAALLACALALSGFHQVSLLTAFLGNMLYIVPSLVLIRIGYPRLRRRAQSPVVFAAAWFMMSLLLYQLFNTPVVWGVLAVLRDEAILPFVVSGWREQPFFFESVFVGLLSALAMTVVRSENILRESRRELATTLNSIADGVISTDVDGRVVGMNPAAEALTGWSEQAARDRPLKEVLQLRSGADDKEVESPVSRVLETGTAVGLANDTRLTARDGTVRQIADSAAPIVRSDGGISGVVMVFRDVSEEYAARERIRRAMETQAQLLQEVHHRVKNNLSVVSALLDLQAARITTKEQTANALHHSRLRIHSMALAHEYLYRSDDFSSVALRDYVADMLPLLRGAFDAGAEVTFEQDVQDIRLNMDVAVPCGLILNELITNALRHAFVAGTGGTIRVSATTEMGQAWTLRVEDNGVGLPDSCSLTEPKTMGLEMVLLLCRQIGAELRVERTRGTRFAIRFPGEPDRR